ncbi:MAG: glycosyltransferase [Clostridia bacterium]|nr:glycosyltransferase [Clostridia bacterium]
MKKVLFFIDTLGHGGAEKVLVNLVNRLDRDKYDITLMTIFDEGVNRKYLYDDIKYKYIFKNVFRGNVMFFKLFTPKWLYKHFVRERYDLVVSYLEGNTTRILSGCPFTDTKKLAWVHIEMDEKTRFYPYRSKKECKACYDKFDRIVCVSNTVKDSFVYQLGELKGLCVKYNTVDSDHIKKCAEEKTEDINFDPECINIISVGRLIEQKSYKRLLSVLKNLIYKGFNVKLYIIGEGSQRNMLERYIASNDLSDKAFLIGFKDNPWKYVSKADLFVCSSRSEGFSTAVTEALILGVPVVTTRCSGMTEMLGENNEYGIITKNNEDSLQKGIEYILSDKELLKSYAQKAAIRGERFKASETVKAVEKMMDEVMS